MAPGRAVTAGGRTSLGNPSSWTVWRIRLSACCRETFNLPSGTMLSSGRRCSRPPNARNGGLPRALWSGAAEGRCYGCGRIGGLEIDRVAVGDAVSGLQSWPRRNVMPLSEAILDKSGLFSWCCWAGGIAVVHCVRERLEPAAGARGEPEAGDRCTRRAGGIAQRGSAGSLSRRRRSGLAGTAVGLGFADVGMHVLSGLISKK